MVCSTFPVVVATICTDWTPAPLFTTSRCLPSGDETALTGRSPSVVCRPAGVIVRWLISLVAPPPIGPGSPARVAPYAVPVAATSAAIPAASSAGRRPRCVNRTACSFARSSKAILLLVQGGRPCPSGSQAEVMGGATAGYTRRGRGQNVGRLFLLRAPSGPWPDVLPPRGRSLDGQQWMVALAALQVLLVAEAVGEDLSVDLVVEAILQTAPGRGPCRAGDRPAQGQVALEEVTRAPGWFQVLQ